MKVTKLMMLAAAILGLAACSSEEDAMDNSTPVAIQINASIAGQGLTRTTTDNATGETTWEAGDAIGIFIRYYDNGWTDEFANKKYVTTKGDGTFTYGGTSTAIFLTNATRNYEVYAYYPADGKEDEKEWYITPKAVDTKVQGSRKNLDFLVADVSNISKTNLKVDFTGDNAFKHAMSQLILKIKTDATAGLAATDVQSGDYYLSGLKHTGQHNMLDGSSYRLGDAEADWNFSSTTAGTPCEDGSDNVRTYRMILFPQDCSTNVITFKATINSKDYICTLNPNLKTGNSYTYTINIKKLGIEVSNCTIADWTPNDMGGGDATM